jgi:hypothetical protein
MKVLLFVLCISAAGYAQESSLEQGKARVLSNLDRQIQNLQKARVCVNTAPSREALQKCRQELNATKKAMNAENKARRAEMMKKQTQLLNSRMKNRKPSP